LLVVTKISQLESSNSGVISKYQEVAGLPRFIKVIKTLERNSEGKLTFKAIKSMHIGVTPKIDCMEINMYTVFHKRVRACAFVEEHWYVI